MPLLVWRHRFGSRGGGSGRLRAPSAVLALPSSCLMVAESRAAARRVPASVRLQVFTSDGDVRSCIVLPAPAPEAASTIAAVAKRATTAASPSAVCLALLEAPRQGEVDHLFLVGGGHTRVQKLQIALTATERGAQPNGRAPPTGGVSFGAGGTSLTPMALASESELAQPAGMCHGDGRLFVSCSTTHRVYCYELAHLTFQFAACNRGSGEGKLDTPAGMAAHMGALFVCDSKNDRIVVLTTRRGIYIRDFGTTGELHGQFLEPLAIDVTTSGAVIVAEGRGARLQLLTIGGEPMQIVRPFFVGRLVAVSVHRTAHAADPLPRQAQPTQGRKGFQAGAPFGRRKGAPPSPPPSPPPAKVLPHGRVKPTPKPSTAANPNRSRTAAPRVVRGLPRLSTRRGAAKRRDDDSVARGQAGDRTTADDDGMDEEDVVNGDEGAGSDSDGGAPAEALPSTRRKRSKRPRIAHERRVVRKGEPVRWMVYVVDGTRHAVHTLQLVGGSPDSGACAQLQLDTRRRVHARRTVCHHPRSRCRDRWAALRCCDALL